MLYFSRWKITLILLSVMTGLSFAVPNFLSDEAVKNTPTWLPGKKVNLGLDLRGGVHLLIQVDREALIKERIETLRDDARRLMRENREVRYRMNTSIDKSIELRLRAAGGLCGVSG